MHKIRNGVLKLITVGNKLKKKGTGFFWDNKDILTSAYNMFDAAKALSEIADSIDRVRVGADEENLGKVTRDRVAGLGTAAKLFTRSRKFAAAVRLVADLFDDDATAAFESDPTSFQKSAAWANGAAKAFSDAGALIDVIPDGLFPGMVKEMWKGLFRAPASYVKAFLSIMQAHIDKLDAASGGSGDTERVTHGVGGDWEGPLSPLYFQAPPDLREFMQTHSKGSPLDQKDRKRSRLDLRRTSEEVGLAQLGAMIEAEGDPETKGRWLSMIQARQKELEDRRAAR